jgi:hypothetical protein
MDEELLRDISMILMSANIYGSYLAGSSAREALKRTMLKIDVTVASSRTLYTQAAIELRLRELLCLPAA